MRSLLQLLGVGRKGGMQTAGVSPVPPGEGSHHIPPYCQCGQPADLKIGGRPCCLDCLHANLQEATR